MCLLNNTLSLHIFIESIQELVCPSVGRYVDLSVGALVYFEATVSPSIPNQLNFPNEKFSLPKELNWFICWTSDQGYLRALALPIGAYWMCNTSVWNLMSVCWVVGRFFCLVGLKGQGSYTLMFQSGHYIYIHIYMYIMYICVYVYIYAYTYIWYWPILPHY